MLQWTQMPTLPHFYRANTVTGRNKLSHNIRDSFTCSSSNVIDVTICQQCPSVFYISQDRPFSRQKNKRIQIWHQKGQCSEATERTVQSCRTLSAANLKNSHSWTKKSPRETPAQSSWNTYRGKFEAWIQITGCSFFSLLQVLISSPNSNFNIKKTNLTNIWHHKISHQDPLINYLSFLWLAINKKLKL